MSGKLHIRLVRLERKQSVTPCLSIVCVDDQGRILDDGTFLTRQWVGRCPEEMPYPVQVLVGVEPLLVLGSISTTAAC
jgi:hypothetical protein